MTYPSQPGQPYGRPPYTGHASSMGYGTPPPKKSLAWLWITLSLILVSLTALGITAFVVPGFLLAADPRDTANTIVNGFNTKNAETLNSVKCADAEPRVHRAAGYVGDVDHAMLVNPKSAGETKSFELALTDRDGKVFDMRIGLKKTGRKWCWNDVGAMGRPGNRE
ncbi:hypothetical protein [Amycolatopsis sp. cmx-11-51]|uniref:hypothetical protein n=1 Tax=unclassified Amycolatopsis TaxID=2618356 RepID=UPI0039E4F146